LSWKRAIKCIFVAVLCQQKRNRRNEWLKAKKHVLKTKQFVFYVLQSYVSTERVEKKIGPDELMRYAKPITVATAKAVAAGNSGRQDDVIAAANMGRKAVFDLLHACKVKYVLLFLLRRLL